jgi:hypothetical protein
MKPLACLIWLSPERNVTSYTGGAGTHPGSPRDVSRFKDTGSPGGAGSHTRDSAVPYRYRYLYGTGKKTPGGAGTHTGQTPVPVLYP